MAVPWTEVLDRSCAWAEKANSEYAVASSITNSIYSSGATYDGNVHYTKPLYTQFYLKALLNSYPSVTMDCRDFANLTHVMTNSIGLNMNYMRIKGNNSDFITKDILPAQGSWGSISWSFHQIGLWSSEICDASLKLNISTTAYVGKLSQGDLSFNEYKVKLTSDTTVNSVETGIANSSYFPMVMN
jgi:hypothetical protein